MLKQPVSRVNCDSHVTISIYRKKKHLKQQNDIKYVFFILFVSAIADAQSLVDQVYPRTYYF